LRLLVFLCFSMLFSVFVVFIFLNGLVKNCRYLAN